MLEGFTYLVLSVAIVVIYLLPTSIAFNRGHATPGTLMLVNVLFGWTMIAWIGCFIWAGTGATDAADAFYRRANVA